MDLKERIEEFYDLGVAELSPGLKVIFDQFIGGLNSGQIRAAEPVNGAWRVNYWVKKGILLGFRTGTLKDYSIDQSFRFFDRNIAGRH